MTTATTCTSLASSQTRPFLVEITFDATVVPSERRDAILRDERQRGRELLRTGKIERIWRIPDTSSSVSIWSAGSQAQVDGWLQGLPIAPWSDFQVTELDKHPLEEERT
jgi:muconolactone D-isomerase